MIGGDPKMSGFDGKSLEFSENPMYSNSPSIPFTRSVSMHPVKPYSYGSLERPASVKKKLYNSSFDSAKGKVRKLCSLFEAQKSVESPLNPTNNHKTSLSDSRVPIVSCIQLPGAEDRVVVYFTSLRGIRRTFEDCYAVRLILRGFWVFVDERDVSMDSAYRKELQSVLGEKIVTLPQVFIRGKYIGGADSIKQLHEIGELAKALKGLPMRAPGYICEACGDVRFVPCANCNGSKKIFDDDDHQLKRCPKCNENGLVRCPTCCS